MINLKNSLNIDLIKEVNESIRHICLISKDGKIIDASKEYASLFSNNGIVIGSNIFDLDKTNREWFNLTLEKGHFKFTKDYYDGDKFAKIIWTSKVVNSIDSHGEYIICYGKDINEMSDTIENFEYKLNHDSLSDLLNYRGLISEVKKIKVINKAICYFAEITSYSSLISYYGYDVGKDIIAKIAKDYRKFLDCGHFVARLFGGNFILLLINPTDEEIIKSNEFMKQSKLKYYKIDDSLVQVRKEIGSAFLPEDTNNIDELVSYAILAKEQSNLKLNEKITRYSPYMKEKIAENISMALKLQNAIMDDKLEVYFQKIVDSKTCEFIHVEALARWYDNELGFIRPDYFFKIAKDSHLNDLLDEYIVKKTIEQYSKLKKMPLYTNTMLNMNITPTSLLNKDFIDYIEKIIKDNGLDNSNVVIEVTEDTFVNNLEECQTRISAYRSRGFMVAIDDFGKEYSSLSILDRIEYDIIKIDGGFVRNINDLRNQVIIEMIITIAALSGKVVIAEGVEDGEISHTLNNMNCIIHQGYYYHKPESLVK